MTPTLQRDWARSPQIAATPAQRQRQWRASSASYRRRNKAKEAARARAWRLAHPGYSSKYVRAFRAGKEQA